MKLNLIKTEAVEITDYETDLGVELVVTENVGEPAFKFSAEFPGVYTVTPSRSYGYGDTVDDALTDLAKALSHERIRICIPGQTERRITAPKLVRTKLLNK